MFIFVPQEELRTQTERIMNAHKIDGFRCTVAPLTSLDLCNRFPKAYFLLDEADMFIKEHLIEYRKGVKTGLNALRGIKSFLFTATLPEYWEACVMALFEVKEHNIITVETVQEVFAEQSCAWDIRGSEFRDREATIWAARERIKEKFAEKPIILFCYPFNTPDQLKFAHTCAEIGAEFNDCVSTKQALQ